MDALLTDFAGIAHDLDARSTAIQWSSKRRALIHRCVGPRFPDGRAASPFRFATVQLQAARVVSTYTILIGGACPSATGAVIASRARLRRGRARRLSLAGTRSVAGAPTVSAA